MNPESRCELCNSPGGAVLWQNEVCRVVRVDEPDYPGFCRVILKRHAREMTDLDEAERDALMQVVWAVEAAVREAAPQRDSGVPADRAERAAKVGPALIARLGP